ncbi:MAG: tetratricopeptide repeat protein [Acidobacteria bacterium]|nr:MAG: tetratricopeptide repeat protein [Acidobacteriota bacterium]REK09632.1 MAG: tetratricopeptide repeat protein [Acidobacteriota bacterium]
MSRRFRIARASKGRRTTAPELSERSVSLCREVFGERHPTTVVAIYDLGRLQHVVGDFEPAGERLQQAVAGARRA